MATAKKKYTINGITVKATSSAAAKKLVKEIEADRKSSGKKKEEPTEKEKSKKEVDDTFERSELEAELKSSGLPSDQQNAIRALYDSISTNDRNKMTGYASALQAGLKMADPYFKAQTRVLLDELDRTLKGKEADTEYKETQLRNALKDLKADIATSGEFLSLEEQNELRTLERQMGTELSGLRDELAATGLTSSSIRSRKEELLADSYGDLRESKTRSYKQQRDTLMDKRVRGERDTEAEVERLQELLNEGKLSLISEAEKEVGTDALKAEGYKPVLGNLPGNITQKKYDYATDFARQFVF